MATVIESDGWMSQAGDVRVAPFGDERTASRTSVIVLGLTSVGLLVAALVVATISISGSSDSPCGSILDERAVWATESACGIAHRGTLLVVACLAACGAGGLFVVSRVASGRSTGRGALVVLATAVVLGSIATAALVWRAATYAEPVLKRGWVAVRNLVAYSTLGLGLAALMVGIVIMVDARRSRT